MPGILRAGQKQALLETNVGKSCWEDWRDWVEACTDDLPDTECLADDWDDLPPLADALISGVLRQGHKMLLAGPSKAGKSFALIELCIAIAEGKTWLGRFSCAQGRVLYINLELDRPSCLHRFKDVYTAMGLAPDNLRNIDMEMVRAYDSSLTSSKAAPLSCPRAVHSAATIGNHLLFAGGYNSTTGKYLSTVESYDASLTRSTAVELSSAKNGLASATVGEYAMFAGGYKGNSDAAYVATVDAYNTALTKTTMPDLSVGRHGLASAVIGDYALFAGGISKISSTADKYQDVVDVYSA